MKELLIDAYPVREYYYVDRSHPSSYRPLKLLLLEKYKVCYWCGIECKDSKQDGGISPSNEATIDHIISRYERLKHEVSEKVLSCYRCNQKRAKLELKIIKHFKNNAKS